MNLRSKLPWHARIAAKLVLSRIPARCAFWHRLDLFSHGSMDRPQYALDVSSRIFERTSFGRQADGYVALELGPGDPVMSAIVAYAYGATGCYLIDAGNFAAADMALYQEMMALVAKGGLPVTNISVARTLNGLLEVCHAEYKTDGLASLRQLPTSSVDFVWSHVVLEHIRPDDFLPTIEELLRVLRPDDACSRRVELKHHVGGGLSNLRIPGRWSEKD
jgi:hypothetical protein